MQKLTYTLCLLFILSSYKSFCRIETTQDSNPKKKRSLLSTIQMAQEVGLFLPISKTSREANPFQEHTRLLGSYSNITMSCQLQKNLSVGFLMSYDKYYSDNYFNPDITSSPFAAVIYLSEDARRVYRIGIQEQIDRSVFFSTLSIMPGFMFQSNHCFSFGLHLGPNILRTSKRFVSDFEADFPKEITVIPNKSVGVKGILSSKYVLLLEKAKITLGSNLSFWSNTINFRLREQTYFSKKKVSQVALSFGIGYVFII